jgi:DUF1365 family protein
MNTPTLNSSLFDARVLHERTSPKRHRFTYGLFYMAIDLDELPALDRQLRLFSVNRRNILSLNEADFLPLGEKLHNPTASGEPATPGTTLKERVRLFCAQHGADPGPEGKVLLITLPRIFGYIFNPVSFFFCCQKNGEATGAIAEVTNTFKETKLFFIPVSSQEAGKAEFRQHASKDFYVSPFSDVDTQFDFQLRLPGDRLAVRIDTAENGRRVVHSTLTGKKIPLNDTTLFRFLLRYPAATVRIMVLIHWQALRLWLRRIPYHAKAAKAEHQRDLYHPHVSIKQTLSSP